MILRTMFSSHDCQPRQSINARLLLSASLLCIGLTVWIMSNDQTMGILWVIGLMLGITLFHSGFGFTAAYRSLFLERDMTGLTAQLLMLALAMVLFAPVLARGEVFGHGVVGGIAPLSTSLVIGAFIFGIGMQLANACASGTLFAVGGGNVSMLPVLVCFCAGCLIATFHWPFWVGLPSLGAIILTEELGIYPAMAVQLFVFMACIAVLGKLGFKRVNNPSSRSFVVRVLHGRWHILVGGILLALLNWCTLLVAGHPWTITWGFTLWAGKVAMLLGWDPSSSMFWSGDFAQSALAAPIWQDTTSVMNIAIMAGSLLAAGLGGARINRKLPNPGQWLLMCSGGLLLGYGARLAYGCNIGAFFAGVATTSLHGWVWLICALLGNLCGLYASRALLSRWQLSRQPLS